jgi:hypothetical protein
VKRIVASEAAHLSIAGPPFRNGYAAKATPADPGCNRISRESKTAVVLGGSVNGELTENKSLCFHLQRLRFHPTG